MNDATKLMQRLFDETVKYRAEVSDPDTYATHLVKAGGMVAVAGMMCQLQVPPENAERMYRAAVDGMAAEAEKIKGAR